MVGVSAMPRALGLDRRPLAGAAPPWHYTRTTFLGRFRVSFRVPLPLSLSEGRRRLARGTHNGRHDLSPRRRLQMFLTPQAPVVALAVVGLTLGVLAASALGDWLGLAGRRPAAR